MADHAKSIYVQDDVLINLEQDNFGHSHIAEAVVDSITNTKPPFIIGIFGGWGTGKSSLLEIIKSSLPTGKTEAVTIDAWRYTSTDNLRRAFLIHVAKELAPKYLDELRTRLYTSEQDTLSTPQTNFSVKKSPSILDRSWSFLKTILRIGGIFLILSILFLALLIIIFSIMNIIKTPGITFNAFFGVFDWQALLSKYLDLAFIPLLLSLVEFFRLNIIQPPVTIMQERLDAEELFSECFEKVVTEVTTKKKRLVIFIDNLDRLADEKMVEALESLKTYISNENCIFVVACDDNVVRSVINSSPRIYQNKGNPRIDGKAGEHYLDKFFQQTFRLPEYMDINLQDFAIANFKTTKLYETLVANKADIRNLISIILPTDVSSPRKVKKLLNEFIALYEIARRRENEVGGQLRPGLLTGNIEFLGKFSTIRTEYPEFYKSLISDTSLLVIITEKSALSQTIVKEILPEEFKEINLESLLAYLQKTQSVMVEDIEPYIWLSQDILSLGLKREHYTQLRTSLSNGNIEQLRILLTNNEVERKYKILLIQVASRLVESRLIGIEQQNGIKVLSQLLPDCEEEIRHEIANVIVRIIPLLSIQAFSPNELFNVVRWAESSSVFGQKRKIISKIIERLSVPENRQTTITAIFQNADIVKVNKLTIEVQEWLNKFLHDTVSEINENNPLGIDEANQNAGQGHRFAEWLVVQGKTYGANNLVIDDYYAGSILDYIINRFLGNFQNINYIEFNEEWRKTFTEILYVFTNRIENGVQIPTYWSGLQRIIEKSEDLELIIFCLQRIKSQVSFFPKELIDKFIEDLFQSIERLSSSQSDQAALIFILDEALSLVIELRRAKQNPFGNITNENIPSIFVRLYNNLLFQEALLQFVINFSKEFGNPDSRIFLSGLINSFENSYINQDQGNILLDAIIEENDLCTDEQRKSVIEMMSFLISSSSEPNKIEIFISYLIKIVGIAEYQPLINDCAHKWLDSIPNDNSISYLRKINLYKILLGIFIPINDYIQEILELVPFEQNKECLYEMINLLEKFSNEISEDQGKELFNTIIENIQLFGDKIRPLMIVVQWMGLVDEIHRSSFSKCIYNSFSEAPSQYLEIYSFAWNDLNQSEIREHLVQFYLIDGVDSDYEKLRDKVVQSGLSVLNKSNLVEDCMYIWSTIINQNKNAESFMRNAVHILPLEFLLQIRNNTINSIRENRASQQSEYDLRLLVATLREDMRDLMPTVDLFVNLFGGSHSDVRLALNFVLPCLLPL
ncbi:KAP family NTPase, partial [bacterium]|nr:KAP family NTPase [bacterium]